MDIRYAEIGQLVTTRYDGMVCAKCILTYPATYNIMQKATWVDSLELRDQTDKAEMLLLLECCLFLSCQMSFLRPFGLSNGPAAMCLVEILFFKYFGVSQSAIMVVLPSVRADDRLCHYGNHMDEAYYIATTATRYVNY